jgi:nucleoside-diphosphate-sugar epimerase
MSMRSLCRGRRRSDALLASRLLTPPLLLLLLLCQIPTVADGLLLGSRCHRISLDRGSSSWPSQPLPTVSTTLHATTNDDDDGSDGDDPSEAERYRQRAEELREQIRRMEEALPPERRRSSSDGPAVPPSDDDGVTASAAPSKAAARSLLTNKRVLVVGANGRLGSMVCRALLRQRPELKEVVACVHVVGENSPTARGYGRLSYEVGAEDGIGSIGPAWSAQDERTARFEYDGETMGGYNLEKLRVVECELLDPVQVATIVENSEADVVVWCATDFNGNAPRAVGTFNVAFLFRAVTVPDKGRVEVEGLQNMLGALKRVRQEKVQRERLIGSTGATATATSTKPVDVLLVSVDPDAMADFETPFGTFYDQKKQGERMIPNDFPSLSYTTIQFGLFEDNFVGEDLEIQFQPVEVGTSASVGGKESDAKPVAKGRKRINRRDAARAVVDALVRPDLQGKIVQVWTDERP